MRKTLRSLASLLFVMISSASAMAQSYDNVNGTLSWAVGDEASATATDGIAAAVLETSVTVGSGINKTTNDEYTALEIAAGTYCTYQPATSNPGKVKAAMIEYTIKMKEGVTFKPTSVVFDAVKEGTDNAYFSWSYTVDGTESTITSYKNPKTQIRRNNNANPDAPLTHDETVSGDAGNVVTLRFYMSDVPNTKKMSIGNIYINGVVNGQAEVVVNTLEAGSYTITANVTLAEGVTEAMVPEAFKKYIGNYTTNATLAGNEASLVITENAEGGLFNGFEVVGNAVALSADKVIVLGGKTFTARVAGSDAETGSLVITDQGLGEYTMDAADIYFKGMKVATVSDIHIVNDATSAATVKATEAAAPSVKKYIGKNGIVIEKNGALYNVAGQMK